MKSPKLQRWLDLLAALLRRHYPVTFDELIPDVPAYAAPGQKAESRRRTFERDKDELRAFGVPIETVPGPDPEVKAYQLRVRDFYLPYLTLRTERPGRPRRIDRYGYQSLPSLAFEPDELAAVAAAATRVRQLGDPLLAEHAESAMRKLACDLPVDAAGRDEPDTRLVPPRARASSELMVLLDGALRARKRVTFRYRSMGSGADGAREAEPFGLFYLNQHWYLAARARGETTVKNYRLSRIADARVNPGRPGTPDYEIPAGFDLRSHAKSRQAWELGAGDALVATVHFRSRTGAAAAAHRLGEEVPGHPDRRHFRVRRSDAFARWMLSFGGDLVPLAPGETTVKNYRLNRIADARVNSERPGTPDYEIPAGFDLRSHANSRQAWELGAGDAVVATVHFRSRTGAAA
ncbi:MAG: helix-turn-helix transcriptional regulator, partial [Gemmatimonadales bacterium]